MSKSVLGAAALAATGLEGTGIFEVVTGTAVCPDAASSVDSKVSVICPYGVDCGHTLQGAALDLLQ